MIESTRIITCQDGKKNKIESLEPLESWTIFVHNCVNNIYDMLGEMMSNQYPLSMFSAFQSDMNHIDAYKCKCPILA